MEQHKKIILRHLPSSDDGLTIGREYEVKVQMRNGVILIDDNGRVRYVHKSKYRDDSYLLIVSCLVGVLLSLIPLGLIDGLLGVATCGAVYLTTSFLLKYLLTRKE